MAGNLCDDCRCISLDVLRSPNGFQHPSSLRDIYFRKSSECVLCSLVQEVLDTDIIKRRLDDLGERRAVRLLVHPKEIGELFITVGCPPYDQGWLGNSRPISRSGDGLVRSLRIYADRGAAAASICRYKTILPEPSSRQAFHLIEEWLHRCVHSHEACRKATSSQLPSRVIDVGPADGSRHPYLYEPSEDSSYRNLSYTPRRYIALSYCWGTHLWAGKTSLTTTASTLEIRKREIRMKDLPQTIRDAVVITRALGIRYLWVDALCILQGSDAQAKADWERESAKLAETYGNAFLTIAAAAARSVHEGVFFPRKLPDRQVALEVSPTNDNSLNGHVYIRNQKFRDCVDEPLYQRGWTLQERILSPRLVVFSHDQLVWNCQTLNTTESGIEMKALGQQRLRISNVLCEGGAMKFWHSIIRDYSCRYLTNATDKLPALSGLAAARHHQTGDEYLAGLWKSSLLDDLLWVRKIPYGGNIVYPSRPKDYRAPSWSWASIDGNINFHRSSRSSSAYFTRLLSYRIELSGIDRFGAVSNGWIKLRGPLVQACRAGSEYGSRLLAPSGEDSIPVPLGEATFDIGKAGIEDAISELKFNKELCSIWVLRIKRTAGLILTAVESDDSWATMECLHDMAAIEVSGVCPMKDPAKGIQQRLHNILRRFPWKIPRAVRKPHSPRPIPPPEIFTVPQGFRRLGMIELGAIGMKRFDRCEEQTVVLI